MMAAGMEGKIRWGFISAGKISNDFAAALKTLPANEHEIVAVAARSKQNAEDFAKHFEIPRAYSSYEQLFADTEIDIVYIGSIHPTHAKLCRNALKSGKHVLCEKPIAINARDAKAVINLAKEKKLFLMEGFWSRFFPAYGKLRETIANGGIGIPRILHASFGFPMLDRDRVTQKEQGGGGILDVGCYVVMLSQMIFGKPEKIVATGTMLDTGVDDTVGIVLQYPENKMAVLNISISCELKNCAFLHGTKGKIEMQNMWCPVEITTPEKTFTFPLPEAKYKINFLKSEGFAYEAQHVRECLLRGDLESPIMPHSDTVTIMETLDEIRKQVGVVFPPDLTPTII